MASEMYQKQTTINPLPLGQAIRALPAQYLKIISRPAVKSFAEEKGKASWSSTWFQLIMLSILSTILYLLAALIAPPQFSTVSGISPANSQAIIMTVLAIVEFSATPITFLIAGAVLYGLSRMFKGDGTYLQQVYTLVLFGVPMVLLSSLLQLIPATSSWLPYVPHLYSLVLLFFSLIAVQHLSKGKALAVMLLPLGIVLVLILVVTILLVVLSKH